MENNQMWTYLKNKDGMKGKIINAHREYTKDFKDYNLILTLVIPKSEHNQNIYDGENNCILSV